MSYVPGREFAEALNRLPVKFLNSHTLMDLIRRTSLSENGKSEPRMVKRFSHLMCHQTILWA